MLVLFQAKRLISTPPLSLAAFRALTTELSRQEQRSRHKRFPSFCFFLLRYTCRRLSRRGDTTQRSPHNPLPLSGRGALRARPGAGRPRWGGGAGARRVVTAAPGGPPGCAAPLGPRFWSPGASEPVPVCTVPAPSGARSRVPAAGHLAKRAAGAHGQRSGVRGPRGAAILFRWGRERIIKIKNPKLDLTE